MTPIEKSYLKQRLHRPDLSSAWAKYVVILEITPLKFCWCEREIEEAYQRLVAQQRAEAEER